MDNDWITQYCRQIALPEIDIAGQECLQAARVLVVGAGGLGSTAALLVAGAGVGTLELVDDDQVALSNLHRQIGHTRSALGRNKVESLAESILARYPDTCLFCHAERMFSAERSFGEASNKACLDGVQDPNALSQQEGSAAEGFSPVSSVKAADVVLDCTDNFAARYALNALCWQLKTPLISAAAIRFEGQLTTFDGRRAASPCYACLYPPVSEAPAENCLSQGVLGPVPSVLASLQALECCRVLLGLGETLVGRVMLFDAFSFSFRALQLDKDPQCGVCAEPIPRIA
jgi:adenylyltransferase/sulfurtransferase